MVLKFGVLVIGLLMWQGTMQPQAKTKFEPGKSYVSNVPISLGDGMTWTWSAVEVQGDNSILFDECGPTCKGKKHSAHKDCDESCDNECQIARPMHTKFVRPVCIDLGAEGENPAPRPHSEKLNNDFDKFGFPSTWNASQYFSRPTEYLYVKNIEGIPLRAPASSEKACWNTGPCSKSAVNMKAKTFILTIEYQLHADPDGSGPQPQQLGPKGTLRYKVLVPTNEFLEPAAPVSNCKCEMSAPVEPPKDHGYLPGGKREEGEYAWVEEGGKKRVMTGQEMASLVTNVTCNDMNTATFQIAPMPMVKACIPAGWELQCIDGGGQNVQLQEDLEIGFVEHEGNWQASLSPIPFITAENTLRTLCLQIDSPEPRPTMKYRLVPPSCEALARLARITRRSSFKGPPDQVRLWIATDFASHAKISKVLIPAPREALYLREMYRAAGVAAINPSDPRVAAIMDNHLLAAEGHDLAAVTWFIQSKLDNKDKSLAAWIQANAAEFKKLFGVGALKDDISLVSEIITCLSQAGGAPEVKAGIALIQAGVPSEHMEAVLKSQGGYSLARLLSSTSDEQVADAILAWFETGKPFFAAGFAKFVNPDLSAAIKLRARALANGGNQPLPRSQSRH